MEIKKATDKLITSDVCWVNRDTGWTGCVCRLRSRTQGPVTWTFTQYIYMFAEHCEKAKIEQRTAEGGERGRKVKQEQVQVRWVWKVQKEPVALLSPTHPSLGCSNLARQEKLQVTTLQASSAEKQIITSALFACLTVGMSNCFFVSRKWGEKKSWVRTAKDK